MPSVALAVPETHEPITRPVCFNVARSLIELTGMPSDTSVYIIGEGRQAPMKGSKLGDQKLGDNTFSEDNRLKIDIAESYIENMALASPVKRLENALVFSDQELGVEIKPAYTATEVTLNIEFRTDDRQSAEKWRDDMRAKASMSREALLHELVYHYPIPKEYLVILNHIQKLKEEQAGYGESLRDWFARCFTKRVTSKTTMTGTEPTLAINEKQVGVLGQFDFDFVPEKSEPNDDHPSWVVNFTYKFVYDKPTECIMNYPLLVHNKLISSKFRSTEPPYDFERGKNHWSLSRYAYEGVRRMANHTKRVAGFSIPTWDDWLPRWVPPHTTTLFNVMLMVDPNDRQALMSMGDIPSEFEIDPDLINYMKSEHMWLHEFGGAAVLVTLFRDDVPLESDYVTVDENLNMRSTVDLDLRRRYHIRISVVNDFFKLSNRAMETLRRQAALCIKFMRGVYPEMEERGDVPRVIGNDYMPRNDFVNTAHAIKSTSTPHQSDIEITRLQVGQYLITAGHKEA